jgi:hypothetical protein
MAEKLEPGSYVQIRWSLYDEPETCRVVGYRQGDMLVRNSSGQDQTVPANSRKIIQQWEVRNAD